MTFEELQNFIENRMRMSHIYQPVMLMTLLNGDGRGMAWSEICLNLIVTPLIKGFRFLVSLPNFGNN